MLEIKYRHVHEDVDRHGNVRLYFWRGRGHAKVRLREKPGSEEFSRRYHELLSLAPGGSRSASRPPGAGVRPQPGSLRALIVDYFAAPQFLQRLDVRTQYVRRGILEAVCQEPLAPGSPDTFGAMPVGRFKSKAVKILRDRKASAPEQGNARVKALRQVFAWALEDERPGIRDNPARDVAYVRSQGDGFHSWTIEEVEKYEARHPVGSKARLALALLMFTGARRSDIVRFGRQHTRAGRLRFTEFKGSKRAPKQRDIPVLAELQAVIDASTGIAGDLTYLVSEFGKPFTSNGFGNRMRKWCDEAGLARCSCHGVRKAAAAIAAENGATDLELMAIFGWDTIKEAQRYTKAARRKHLVDRSMHLVVRSETRKRR